MLDTASTLQDGKVSWSELRYGLRAIRVAKYGRGVKDQMVCLWRCRVGTGHSRKRHQLNGVSWWMPANALWGLLEYIMPHPLLSYSASAVNSSTPLRFLWYIRCETIHCGVHFSHPSPFQEFLGVARWILNKAQPTLDCDLGLEMFFAETNVDLNEIKILYNSLSLVVSTSKPQRFTDINRSHRNQRQLFNLDLRRKTPSSWFSLHLRSKNQLFENPYTLHKLTFFHFIICTLDEIS